MSDMKVVTTDIPAGDPGRGVYAYRVGDRLPADVVSRNGWQDYVSGEQTKSAQQAVAAATGATKES